MNLFERSHHIWPTLPCRGRVGLPKAVRGGVTATQYVLKRCHPLPARWRGPTSPQPNLAIARVRPLKNVTEVGNSRLRLGEVAERPPCAIPPRHHRAMERSPPDHLRPATRTPSRPGPTLSLSMAARVSFAPHARRSPRWGFWTFRSWASPRGRTVTPGGKPFICRAGTRFACHRAIPCSISRKGCATRRIGLPSDRTASVAVATFGKPDYRKSPVSDRPARGPCYGISARSKPSNGPRFPI